jgi:hypothetical protein
MTYFPKRLDIENNKEYYYSLKSEEKKVRI